MDTKRVQVQVKDADQGLVSAVFATFNTKDSDGDVTLPGAFTEGATVLISAFGHAIWQGALPVGKGTIRTTEGEAIFDGQFFMDTESGRETFKVVKEAGDLMEWSYGYIPQKHSFGEFEGDRVRFLEVLKTFEVSPVLGAAGVGTRTMTTKSGDVVEDGSKIVYNDADSGPLPSGKRFSEEAQEVLTSVKSLTDRAADILVKRQEKGKGLGEESTELLEQIDQEMKRLRDLFNVPDVVSVEELGEDDKSALYLIRIHQGV